jgi:hypothetical protein
MIPVENINPSNWKKELYIASKLRVELDEEENEISVYDTPQPYKFNYQSTLSDSEIAEFGEEAKQIQKAVIPISYKDQFKEFDVAYLDGATPTDEIVNGYNANYELMPPRNGNAVIIIYFRKIVGK